VKYIYTLVLLVAFFNLNLFAKDDYFDPFKPKVKKVLKKKSHVKSKKQKIITPKKSKIKKIKSNRYSARLSYNLDKIYKKVLKKSNINKRALKRAFAFYKRNRLKKGLSSKYIAIADYTKTAKNKRLYIINLKNGVVYKHKIAHGKYSGSIGGKVKHSSNRCNTNMTPYGFFKVGSKVGKTKKKRYQYLSVKGLEWSNRKVGLPPRMGGRDIVMHPAKYVNYGGRSHGCFSICPQDRRAIFAKLKKALFYSYTGR